MSCVTFTNILSWDSCPPELLWIIFKGLDYKSLLSCMTVNRRWKDVAESYIEFHCLWTKIKDKEVVNMGLTFQRKSLLDDKDIVMNSILWTFVSSAQVILHNTYTLEDITRMHVYKDNLIVKIKEGKVNYFDITNSKLKKFYERSSNEVDFIENDHMIAVVFMVGNSKKEIVMYGKVHPDDCSFSTRYVAEDIILYKLEDSVCFVVTQKFEVWAYLWNRDRTMWDKRIVGRYYGTTYDKLYGMHVFNKRVSLITEHGMVFRQNPDWWYFEKAVRYSVARPKDATNWVLFNNSDVAVSVPNEGKRISIFYEEEYKHTTLECADMTCAIEHGEMLIIGFKDGVVAICRPEVMLGPKGEAELYLSVKDFDSCIEDPSVVALEVFEDKLSHHLFVATAQKVLHLLVTYPFNTKTYYE